MKLSVIIPVYNAERYLERCLASIIEQDYENKEIIIVNDGSTDNSEKIIKDFMKNYTNIIYIKQDNKGQAYARNIGITKAKGQLITFVDSDDYIEPKMYTTMINKMINDKTDMVICDMYYINNDTKTIVSGTSFENIYESLVSLCNKIFKKELINNLRFIENIWYEDYNFFIKLCLREPNYTLCKEPFYNYCIHENSTMNNNNAKKNLDIIIATDDIIRNADNKEIQESLIINHILLDSINRVQNQESKDKKDVIKELTRYVKKHIKNIFKTKSFKKSSLKKKIILILNYYNLSNISHSLLKIRSKTK